MQDVIFNKVTGDNDDDERKDFFCDVEGTAKGREQEKEGQVRKEAKGKEIKRMADILGEGREESVNEHYHSSGQSLNNRFVPRDRDKMAASEKKDKFLLYKRLPFIKRKEDFGQWVDRHKVGVSITVLVYIIAVFTFASVRIDIITPEFIEGVFIEVPPDPVEADPKPEEPEPEPEDSFETMDMSDIRNVSANANAQLDAGLKDDRGTDASKIYEDAQRVQEQLNASREAYRRGLSEVEAIGQGPAVNERPRGNNEETEQKEDVKVQGNVTVEYDLANRRATYLLVPAYRCQEGGRVVVNITVNQNGDVVSVSLNKATASKDNCIVEMALDAARNSRFDVNGAAPARQNGTITYLFLSQ